MFVTAWRRQRCTFKRDKPLSRAMEPKQTALAKLKSMSKKLTGLRIAGPLVARGWLRALLSRSPPPSAAQQRAADLIAGIDAGGLPPHPARVNDIARLGSRARWLPCRVCAEKVGQRGRHAGTVDILASHTAVKKSACGGIT